MVAEANPERNDRGHVVNEAKTDSFEACREGVVDGQPVARKWMPMVYYPMEMVLYCIVSFLDVGMTFGLLAREDVMFVESNPVADYFLYRWGVDGMAYFKASMTVFVCIISQVIAQKNPLLAKRVLGVSILIVLTVVMYSVWLQFRH